MKVSVICCADRPNRLPLLYWSLAAQNHYSIEFIVLDQMEDAPYQCDLYLPKLKAPHIDYKYYPVKNFGDWGQTIKEMYATKFATGDAFMFPADDAYYVPTALGRLLAGLEKGADVTVCGWLYDLVEYKAMPPAMEQGHIDVGGFIVRREAFLKVGWPNKGQTGDWELIRALMLAGAVFATDPSILYVKN